MIEQLQPLDAVLNGSLRSEAMLALIGGGIRCARRLFGDGAQQVFLCGCKFLFYCGKELLLLLHDAPEPLVQLFIRHLFVLSYLEYLVGQSLDIVWVAGCLLYNLFGNLCRAVFADAPELLDHKLNRIFLWQSKQRHLYGTPVKWAILLIEHLKQEAAAASEEKP